MAVLKTAPSLTSSRMPKLKVAASNLKLMSLSVASSAALPGCNPVQPGPVATPQSGCGAPTTITASNATFFTDLTSKGWAYMGCGTDNYFTRILTGTSESNDQMTSEACAAYCDSKGFSMAGTEYSRECYCK